MKHRDASKHKKSLRKRTRDTNPIPFWDRILVSPTEVIRYLCIGRRKLAELAAEGRVEFITIDHRNYATTASLRRLIDSGLGVRLPEPPQMLHAKAAKAQAL